MFSQQSNDHKAQNDNLVGENNNIKEQLIKIHKEYSTTNTLNSLLEEDVFKRNEGFGLQLKQANIGIKRGNCKEKRDNWKI